MDKKVLMVLAPQKFRDEEFFGPKAILESAGIKVFTANSSGKPSKSKFGRTVSINTRLDAVEVEAYDAIIFVGGSGCSVYFDDPIALELVKKFYTSGKIVAAICMAPTILANAGILKGKRATAYISEQKRIAAVGIYTGADVERDGNIITAKWPTAAKKFGQAIVKALVG